MNKKQKTILERGDYVTDYVANGSFKSLKDNVTYNKNKDYAILLRLVDYTKGFNGPFTYVDKHSYDFLKKSSVQPGDIIISNVGENVGTVFKAPDLGQPMTLGPNSILVRMGNEDAAFWYYWFNSSEGQFKLKSIVSSSAQPKFNKTSFRELTVPDVSILQQRKVASVLSALDDKIELNRKINIELEQMARTLYDYWFVQFDFPDANGKPYKSSGGQMAYNDQLKRNIPAGWSAVKLNDFTKIVSGFPFKSSTYIEDGRYKVITIKNVKSGELDSSGADTIDDVPKNLPDNCRLDVGDLLVSLTGNVGRMAFVTEYDLLLNQRVGKL
ncbi:restriction endonuclease subunit S, partial [Candidatus Saccharibacteria bacterium]|nr:restriction endonuclease subunit S [Candidatus Saccharibacteria bacterium]